MFSSTVRCGNSPPLWITYPIWRRSVVLRRDLMALPSQVILPLLGSSIRLTIRNVVVLPHPEGPTITVIFPDGTTRLRLSTAVVPSRKVLETDSNSITRNPCCLVWWVSTLLRVATTGGPVARAANRFDPRRPLGGIPGGDPACLDLADPCGLRPTPRGASMTSNLLTMTSS